VARAWESARAACPGIALPLGPFAGRALAIARTRDPVAPDRALALMSLEDLFLAVACDAGAAGAWETFQARYLPRVRGLADRLGASSDEARELTETLPGYLCEPPPAGQARTRLGTYDGTGSLFGWLSIIVRRRILLGRRAPGARESSSGPTSRASRDSEPLPSALNVEGAGLLEEAFRTAWSRFSPLERIVFLFRFRDGRSQKEIAGTLQVSEPRVSVLLKQARAKLQETVLQRLGPGLAGGDGEWNALRDAVARILPGLPVAGPTEGGNPVNRPLPLRLPKGSSEGSGSHA
jgi:RNA polymerase sigma factor (sigma-70 family)